MWLIAKYLAYVAVPFSKTNSTINNCVDKFWVYRLRSSIASLGDCFKLFRPKIWNTLSGQNNLSFYLSRIYGTKRRNIFNYITLSRSDAIARAEMKNFANCSVLIAKPVTPCLTSAVWKSKQNCCVRIWYHYQLHYLYKFFW